MNTSPSRKSRRNKGLNEGQQDSVEASRDNSKTNGSNANQKLSQNALSSASLLVLLQLSSRLLTFVFNQVLVRLATPRAFGTAAVQFELLSSTILFLCREGVRGALLRSNDGGSKVSNPNRTTTNTHSHIITTTNISHLPFLLGTPFAISIGVLYTKLASSHTAEQPFFKLAVGIYTLSAMIELFAEPLYIRAQNDLRVKVRVSAEGAGVVCKAVLPVLVLLSARLSESGPNAEHWTLLAFAFGQLGYALALLAVYINAYNAQAVLHGVHIRSVSHPDGR